MAEAEERHLASGVPDEVFARELAKPQSFSVGDLSQSNRSIGDLIALDKHLEEKASRHFLSRKRNPLRGLVSVILPPGTCDR